MKPKRTTITIRLATGYKLKISNRAKRENISFSEAVRRAISAWLMDGYEPR